MEPGEDTVKAVRKRRTVLAQLDGEPVRGVDAGVSPSASCRAACSATSRTLRDHVGITYTLLTSASPTIARIEYPRRPVQRVASRSAINPTISELSRNYGYLLGAMRRCYGRLDHGSPTPWSIPPDVGAREGHPCLRLSP